MTLNGLPQFTEITPEKIVNGCSKRAIEYETQFGSHVEALSDPKTPKSFHSVFDPIEAVAAPLNSAWRMARHMQYVNTTTGLQEAFHRAYIQTEQVKRERWLSHTLFNAVKEVRADRDNLSEYQQRLADMYWSKARLNGMELTGKYKKQFDHTQIRLSTDTHDFRNRVWSCHGLFEHRLDDFGAVKDLPRSLLHQMAADKANPGRGPWTVSLQESVYHDFLKYCGVRSLRWNTWKAFNSRADVSFGDRNMGNHKAIDEIRIHRRDIAGLLGYDNYAHMAMATKMAPSIESVLTMMETFKTQFQPLAEEEIARLQEFANAQGFRDTLQMWDLSYWKHQHEKDMFNLDDDMIAQYFPLPSVLDGLFSLCHRLFGIKITEKTESDVNVWNREVKCFEIADENGNHIATFFLDPYARQNKCGGLWFDSGRERSELVGTRPISYLVMNVAPSAVPNRPALLTMRDVKALFHEFGHGLQQMLTTVPYSEVSGQRNIEQDARQICSTFMKGLLYKADTLRAISQHVDNGATLSDDVIQRIIGAENHMAGYNMMRQLYLGAYDMEIYISKDHWHVIMQRVWADYMPLPLSKDDQHPCSLIHMFCEEYPASYYSHKWSEMIAADILDVFDEAAAEGTESLTAVGRRFRDTFLSHGGGVPASEVFRRFRGRDPSLEALQVRHGVLKPSPSANMSQ